eukprot:9483399-Pyramimonas_sp.AAC.1
MTSGQAAHWRGEACWSMGSIQLLKGLVVLTPWRLRYCRWGRPGGTSPTSMTRHGSPRPGGASPPPS